MIDSVTWKIGGEAGFGIMSSGIILSRLYSRGGYHILATNEYPSLIRGGHNLITVRIATKHFDAMTKDVHFLVALNADTVARHKDELNEGAIVIYDPSDHEWQSSDFPKKVVLIPVPFKEIIKQLNVGPIMRNTIAIGTTCALFGTDFQLLQKVLEDQFAKKGEEIIKQNVAIAKAGYDYIAEHFKDEASLKLLPGEIKESQLVLNGSEAVGVGAVRAGLKFAAIYPMTPINSLITYLADHAKEFQLVYKQPEDEVAGINMAIGAAVNGVRSMVATSGGGFALMVEGLSLAAMIEVPLVIDLGMRVGPATGMPTYTEQGELQFAIHAGHGEFPRIILAPSDAYEAYKFTIDAFNLAETYQVPVFILTDKYLNESQWCAPKSFFMKDVQITRDKRADTTNNPPDTSFKRYDLTLADGISPRSIPGMKNGQYFSNSYEHDETGHVSEAANVRSAMVEKRLRKAATIVKASWAPNVEGDVHAQVTFVTWGSTKGAVVEAMKMLAAKGKSSKLVTFSWIYPFPAEEAKKVLTGTIIDVEQNATAQLASLIREHTGIEIQQKILKYDGRPLFPEEIVEKVQI